MANRRQSFDWAGDDEIGIKIKVRASNAAANGRTIPSNQSSKIPDFFNDQQQNSWIFPAFATFFSALNYNRNRPTRSLDKSSLLKECPSDWIFNKYSGI